MKKQKSQVQIEEEKPQPIKKKNFKPAATLQKENGHHVEEIITPAQKQKDKKKKSQKEIQQAEETSEPKTPQTQTRYQKKMSIDQLLDDELDQILNTTEDQPGQVQKTKPKKKKSRDQSMEQAAQEVELAVTKPKKTKKYLQMEEEKKIPEIEGPLPNKLEDYLMDKTSISILRKNGIKYLFPIQEKCYNPIFSGKDIIGKDRTGSGKTLAYAVPIIEQLRADGLFKNLIKKQKAYVLVLLPTRELAIQVANVFKSLWHYQDEFRIGAIYGGTDIRAQQDQLWDGLEIVVGTPGRIMDQYERRHLTFSSLKIVVLDEADQMLQKFGFQEDIEKIFSQIKNDQKLKTQNVLFSATIPRWIHDIANQYLSKDRLFLDMVKESSVQTTTTVEHLAINCHRDEIINTIGDVILCYGGGVNSRCIIFCEKKSEANDIMLKGKIKQDCQVLHGDIPQKQREITFHAFKEGKFKCLIATNIASRGLDIPQVDLIIQCEPSKDIDTYIHRAGRTARAGRKGVCVTFYMRKHIQMLDRIEQRAGFKFKRVGAPQLEDILKFSCRDIVTQLKSVSKEALELFREVTKELIDEVGAEEALSRAIAYISGYTGNLKQRSLLSSFENYITYMISTTEAFRSVGYVWSFIRNNFSQQCNDSIKGMKKLKSNKGCVFDVAVEHCKEFNDYIEKFDKGEINRGLKIEIPKQLPDLDDDNGPNRSYEERQEGRDKFQAFKNKALLECFIGMLPFDQTEEQIYEYFRNIQIEFHTLRLMRDKVTNESRGCAFGVCKNIETVQKLLGMHGKKYGNNSKPLRINMASDKR